MGDLYIKNKKGEFIPADIKSFFAKEMEGKLVVIRVGTDEHPASSSDLEETADSLSQADILSNLKDVSVIITPLQIDVGVISDQEEEEKHIYLQISSGDDIGMLEEQIKKMFRNIRKKFDTVVLPTPLKVKDYRMVKDILKRSEIRKERRGKSRG